eukprot:3981734-Amphidinium_carterae.1
MKESHRNSKRANSKNMQRNPQISKRLRVVRCCLTTKWSPKFQWRGAKSQQAEWKQCAQDSCAIPPLGSMMSS